MNQNIIDWVIPNWHPDFGNPKEELLILQKTCLFLHNFNTSLTFQLDCYEEGYMRIEIDKENIFWGELHVVDVSTKRIGLFKPDGEELYFSIDVEITIEEIKNIKP
jgi:hypothetical protein